MKTRISWHSMSLDNVSVITETDLKTGLGDKDSKVRLKNFGKNEFTQKKRFSTLKLIGSQFTNFLTLILIGAGFAMYFLDRKTDVIVIFIAVIINAGFGFWEEYKVSQILQKLKKTLKTKAVVIREGKKKVILKEELVFGDIICFKAGDKIPADARLLSAKRLTLDQSVLSGEWVPAPKAVEDLNENVALFDRSNMVYEGSLVEAGDGQALIVQTGVNTEAGKIANFLEKTKDEKTPLQKKLNSLGRTLAILISLLCVALFIGGMIRNEDPVWMIESAIAVAVGGIPEAMPVVITVALAISMERLLKKRGLIRKLSSVETLGSTSVICFDKTKTLTKGEMRPAKLVSQNMEMLLKIAAFNNETLIENREKKFTNWKVSGSPTDKALLLTAAQNGFLKPQLEKSSREIQKLRFDPTNKYQLSIREEKDKTYLYATGAPEEILKYAQNKEGWVLKTRELTDLGYRVVALGFKQLKRKKTNGALDCVQEMKGLQLVGLISFIDPLRKGTKKIFKTAKSAGLTPVIITGDHPNTAREILNSIGEKIKKSEILVGKELDLLNESQLAKIIPKIKIYARTEPRHKIRIVSAWQKKGKTVAMVGDGINDAPAIKQADIGLAQGSGTEIAKEAADLILLDDSFRVIIKAIEEGRIILDNLRKSVSYMLADTLTSIIVVGGAKVVFGWPLPILPVQLLWNNIVEDTLPSVAYAFEPKEKGIMRRKPQDKNTSFFTPEMKTLIIFTGLIDEFLILLMFWILWQKAGYDLEHVRTMVFGAICLDTAFVAYSYKNLKKNVWEYKLFSNKWLNLATFLVIVSFALAVYLPVFQKLLSTVPLSIIDWGILISICIISVFLIEITKWFYIRKNIGNINLIIK